MVELCIKVWKHRFKKNVEPRGLKKKKVSSKELKQWLKVTDHVKKM